jgi:hypothetical protein
LKLANYISDLLYRYECVIVPGFGGFVTNIKSAKIDAEKQILQPPYKQITFNSHLKNNDGLLANYIATVDKIKYECALNFIKFEIETWMAQLQYEDLYLTPIGSFTLTNNNLIFEPQEKINYLPSSFGLTSIIAPEIKREAYIRQVQKIEKKAPIFISETSKKAPNYLKYAAIFVIGLSVIGLGGKFYNDYQNRQMILVDTQEQNELEQKIENATFVIGKTLPTLNLNLKATKKSFHVIAGAFRFPENAVRKTEELQSEGYESRILGVNKWNLSVVSYGSYSTREEAEENLSDIKNTVAKDAWLLVQEF